MSGLPAAVRDGGTPTLVLTGELDLLAVPALTGQLASILNGRPGQVVFDLTGVTFIDCAAARLLVQAGQDLTAGRKPVLTGCGPAVRRLLGLAGLAAYVDVH